MRALLTILFILVGTGFAVFFFAPETYSCLQPIRYSVGDFDHRFNVSEEELLVALKTAEAAWEETAGKNLFEHSANGRFKVNLVYDERQRKTDLVEESEAELNERQQKYKLADERYFAALENYELQAGELRQLSRSFEKENAAVSERVQRWNRSPRTNTAELNAIKKEQEKLASERRVLQQKEREVRSLYDDTKRLLDERNSLVKDYNVDVTAFNQQFGTGESFDQGIYSRGQINIYQFRDLDDLALVLAHEFGHALGIDHVDDPKAVMHYLMEEQTTSPITLTDSDRSALFSRCKF